MISRMMFGVALGALVLFSTSHMLAQGRGGAPPGPLPAGQTNEPFPQPIARTDDPLNLAQNLSSAFGKVFRIDPLGKNSRNGKYGIPAANPFVKTADALPEIFAYGIRNTQRFGWDPKNGAMFMSDIGQNIVEEVSPMSAGANLGWNIWEGTTGLSAGRP